MRRTIILIAALALGAAPAAAQNETVDANADVATMNAADTNAAAPDANGLVAAPGTENLAVTTAPAPADTAAVAPAPAPARERGFPWGVIGLVGLIGLLGRRRRD